MNKGVSSGEDGVRRRKTPRLNPAKCGDRPPKEDQADDDNKRGDNSETARCSTAHGNPSRTSSYAAAQQTLGPLNYFSHPGFNCRYWNYTSSTASNDAGRGLSPPARTYTDPEVHSYSGTRGSECHLQCMCDCARDRSVAISSNASSARKIADPATKFVAPASAARSIVLRETPPST